MITITDNSMREALRQAVALRGPDYQYLVAPQSADDPTSTCFYTRSSAGIEGDNEGCLIGLALTILGVPRETLVQFDDRGRDNTATVILAELSVAGTISCDDDVADMCATSQRYQDQGQTWGYAFRAATGEEWTAPVD